MNWVFDLSYSSYSTYKDSQLLFYYNKVVKAESDTFVNSIYGNLGQLAHTYAEKYIKNNNISEEQIFNALWKRYNIDNRRGFYNSIIPKTKWFNYIKILKKFISLNILNKNNIITEKYLEYVGKEFDGMKIKGYIDVFIKNGEEIYLYDWKTNSTYSFEMHELQRKFYSWLCYKVYGIIPIECNWFYTNKAKSHKQTFTKKEMDDFSDELIKFKNDILIKMKSGITSFELGSFDTPFNSHLKKCIREQARRNQSDVIITGKLYNNRIYLSGLSNMLIKILHIKYSYFVPGYQWSNLFKRKVWDGKKHLFKNSSIPYGFLYDFKKILEDYSTHTQAKHIFKLEDKRTPSIIDVRYHTVFKDNDIELRGYQKESVQAAIDKKVGILYLGTSAGKTFISAEIIKRLNRRTLFLVNRIELVRQTKDEYEKYLGVKIGTMTEGEIDTKHQITIASIQTLDAILKRQNETSKQLRLFFHNITLVIYDEAQNLTDSGMYGNISKCLTNNDYFIGLSGSPWRNDGSTLELNSLCGFPIYEYSTKDLERDGWITPTKCYFIDYETKGEDKGLKYPDVYSDFIVHGEKRNSIISNIANQNRKKKKILVLTKRVEHAQILGDLIEGSVVITGSSEKKFRKQAFKDFKEKEGIVLVGSLKIFSAGIDVPNLDILINATGHKSSVDSIQTVGRLKRKAEGKAYGYFIDFIDRVKYLFEATKERKSILQDFGNSVEVLSSDDKIRF